MATRESLEALGQETSSLTEAQRLALQEAKDSFYFAVGVAAAGKVLPQLLDVIQDAAVNITNDNNVQES